MEHTPNIDAAAMEKLMADRRQMADVVFDRLLLSRYHRSLADLELLPDPEGRQEADHVAEFCYEIEDHLRALLREHRGESPEDLRRKNRPEETGEGGISSDSASDPVQEPQ
jgi:hypothetical protein